MEQERVDVIAMTADMNTPIELVRTVRQLLKGGNLASYKTERLINTEETCAYLAGISRSKLWGMRQEGLPYHSLGGRICFRPSEIDAWVTSKNSVDGGNAAGK